MDELECLNRAQAGDLSAFAVLVEKHEQSVYNLCFRMLGHREDAADLTQEAFLRAFQSLKKFRGESRFSTWIYRIATNLCLDEKRKRKIRRNVSLDQAMEKDNPEHAGGLAGFQPMSEDPGPENIAEQKDTLRSIQEAMEQLDDDFRTVLVLRDVMGNEYNEIAEILQIPVGTVKSRLYRARRLMRNLLAAQHELFFSKPVNKGRGGSSDAVL